MKDVRAKFRIENNCCADKETRIESLYQNPLKT